MIIYNHLMGKEYIHFLKTLEIYFFIDNKIYFILWMNPY